MTPKTDRYGFRTAYDNLPCKSQREVRKEITTLFRWSLRRFYSRMTGESAIREDEIKGVEEVFKKYGLDAWTGNRLYMNGL